MQIQICNQQEKVPYLPQHRKMIELISREIAKRFSLAENIEVSITLADDILMRQLNKEYRDQDESTDVLSFAFRENEMPSVPGLEIGRNSFVVGTGEKTG